MAKKRTPLSKRPDPPLVDQLRAAIRDSGLSVKELAARVDVTHQQVYRFLAGDRTVTVKVAGYLADVLGLELAEKKKGR